MVRDLSLFSTPGTDEQVSWQQASRQFRRHTIALLTTIFMVFFLGYALNVEEWPAPDGSATHTMLAYVVQYPGDVVSLIFAAPLVIIAIAYIASVLRHINMAAYALMFLWYCMGVVVWIVAAEAPAEAAGPIVTLIVLGGLVLAERGIVVALLMSLLSLLVWSAGTNRFDQATTSLATVILLSVGASVIVWLFLRYITQSRVYEMQQMITEREKTAAILRLAAQRVGERATPQELASDSVKELCQRFGFIAQARLYSITGENRDLHLLAEAGERPHTGDALPFQLAAASLVGQVAQDGEQALNRIQGRSADGTGTLDMLVNVAFPLRLGGGGVIGVLELHSYESRIFQHQPMLATFQEFADSLALAIDNATQFEALQAQAKEKERLAQEAALNLQKVERLNQRFIGQAWSEYMRKTGTEISRALNFDAPDEEGLAAFADDALTEAIQEAVQQNNFVVQHHEDSLSIALPLRVRGRLIGAMEFELDKDHILNPEDIDMVQEVTDRLGLAVENTRLVAESQLAAQRETFVNQISSRLQVSNNVGLMLEEAARGLNTALKADKIAIRLSKPTPQNTQQEG